MPSASKSPDLSAFYRLLFNAEPYPYQRRLAAEPWPDLLDAPTGLGKTAAVFLAWLVKRERRDADTPRRLVWCLPMRVLVEQCAALFETWIDKLDKAGLITSKPAVHVLMGGRIDRDWDGRPEDPVVLVGTQDQLLSRALNRGYAMSRFRWPLDFALLHNDCLWVFDEVQLMGAGLVTSAQLEAFREKFETFLPCRSLWCSATLRREWLDTVDFKTAERKLVRASLNLEDMALPAVRKRREASKPLERLALDGKKPDRALAEAILERHRPGALTLVIRNTVRDATATFQALEKAQKKRGIPLTLLHSRFRPPERRALLEEIREEPGAAGRIVVSTQVVEAGVDIDAARLFTDIAPWSSLVQRFGRCNRAGECDDARIFWLDRNPDGKNAAPYEPEELRAARALLEALPNAAPANLPEVKEAAPEHAALRVRDLLDLFDTTPDLAGADIDIDRFIQARKNGDLRLFWRNWEGEAPPDDLPAPSRDELCPAPAHEAQAWLDDGKGGKTPRRLWRWDALSGRWAEVSRLRPGMTLLAASASGGYDARLGWNGRTGDFVEPVPLSAAFPPEESMDGDRPGDRATAYWQTLEEHAARAEEELADLVKSLGLPALKEFLPALRTAARLHDWGKAHAVFQAACVDADPARIWAKAPKMDRYARPGFRHELASALALLATGHDDLTAYLAAAHHGKIRLSLRSMPGEKLPPDVGLGRRFARGIWEGDELPEMSPLPPVTLSLACMELGLSETGPSWTDRMERLLEEYGPFRLAFLESLVRLADWRASAAAESKEDGNA